jgi:hypothetical protein
VSWTYFGTILNGFLLSRMVSSPGRNFGGFYIRELVLKLIQLAPRIQFRNMFGSTWKKSSHTSERHPHSEAGVCHVWCVLTWAGAHSCFCKGERGRCGERRFRALRIFTGRASPDSQNNDSVDSPWFPPFLKPE